MPTSQLFLAVLIAALVLLGTGAVMLLWAERRDGGSGPRLRGLAVITAGVTLLLYAWGLLHVLGAVTSAEGGGTDSLPLRPCRSLGDEVAARTVGYDIGLVPLRFVCETGDGGRHPSPSVPAYVNPGVAVLALGAVGLGVRGTVGAGRAARRRAAASGDRPG
ncbi:hypothetical protein ABZ930_20990 [Streptomyces sp. NPDC046716]|uniref:hypothetical protein n=1 Tax=Streptomyces sp. NPDC046716 TaxID=3157093 RepID=UPI0033C70505